MKTLHFGDVTVDRLVEAEGPGFHPGFFLPEAEDAAIAAQHDWLLPHFLHADSGRMIQSVHVYVIRTPRHTILVDTCIGNDKERPSTPPWSGLSTPWLDDLGALGVAPEDVDFVMCTHLHVDHVGWNTRLLDGRWVPTFPNAKYLFEKTEYAHWAAGEEDGIQGLGSNDGCFEDSVLPVMAAGQAILVDGDHALDDQMWLEPTPGHSPGHVCMNLSAAGQRAVFSGDLMHHAVQVAHPEWNSRFCWNGEMSRASREKFVHDKADTDTLILTAHFPSPTAGRIVGNGERCKFVPVEG
ncbi:MAG: MBL fold metallo-hydrolase [Alphaproteobacteria bacterium]|jgi:glyoxylase-like metal-dependent hydrolase (beta-lactamase superfamily II)